MMGQARRRLPACIAATTLAAFLFVCTAACPAPHTEEPSQAAPDGPSEPSTGEEEPRDEAAPGSSEPGTGDAARGEPAPPPPQGDAPDPAAKSRDLLQERIPLIQECFEEHDRTTTSGELTIVVDLGSEGEVSDVRILRNTFSSGLADCVKELVASWVFPTEEPIQLRLGGERMGPDSWSWSIGS